MALTTSLLFPKGEIRREPEGSLGELALTIAKLRTRTYLLCRLLVFMTQYDRPRDALLVYPDDRGFLYLRVLLPEFAGGGAERNASRMREIRSRPFSLGGGVTRGGEDILFLRHRRIRCVCRMTRKLVDLRFIADIGRATKVLGKCRAGGK